MEENTQLSLQKFELKSEDKEMPDGYYKDITLRPFDLSDVEDFMLLWVRDENVKKFCYWGSQDSEESVTKYMVNVVIAHPWFRAICLKGRPVGLIMVTPKSGISSCRAELGYILSSKYWGRGIATWAVKMVTATIFIEWPHLARLEATVDVENPGSRRVLEKAGFMMEGVLRRYLLHWGKPIDMFMFSLISTDPKI